MSETTFTPPPPLKTAVLFLVFNRLDTTKQVFEAIRKAKPPRLYIAADGARENKEGEAEKVKAVRDYVMTNIDWECETTTLFREQNLGCKMAVSGAIDWFFENEEMGIIIEDDCLPSQSFFWFCEELLERYRDDMRVGMISGDNFQKGIKRGEADYYFSIYSHIWGWASWANRWKNYDVDLHNVWDINFMDKLNLGLFSKLFWRYILRKLKNNQINTWDYQWSLTLFRKDQLTIIPNLNLVQNIGFGSGATHTKRSNNFSEQVSNEMVILNHPSEVCPHKDADIFTSKEIFNFLVLLKNKIKSYI